MKFRIIAIITVVLSLSACSSNKQTKILENASADSSATLKYAKWFSIDYYPDYKCVSVINPWVKNKIINKYYLVNDSSITTPSDGYKIKIPIRKLAVNSCSHLGFLGILKESESVIGICTKERIYDPIILKRCAENKCTDIGDAFAINYEKTLLIQAEAVMVSTFNQTDNHVERIRDAKIPVIDNVEWMESHILGRAEWIKFVAAFYNKEHIADSIFNEVCFNYDNLKSLAKVTENRPNILPGLSFKGTWYMPGGNSFMGRLFFDAGGNYKFSDDTTSTSLPISFEVALKYFKNCDIWLGVDANSFEELKAADDRLCMFKAYRTKNVYNNNKRTTPSGGNDFWESALARPDILLKDLIIAMHPELLPGQSCFYIKKLE
ncbi:MAG TPA: ABC transporter substrate-binding protein [Candidatus Enterocola sp.]|jgi:iron complex transport system substrate-binding protein|nr:ABC transporter substrate-binding protein [Candidatus Enterocola sp.]